MCLPESHNKLNRIELHARLRTIQKVSHTYPHLRMFSGYLPGDPDWPPSLVGTGQKISAGRCLPPPTTHRASEASIQRRPALRTPGQQTGSSLVGPLCQVIHKRRAGFPPTQTSLYYSVHAWYLHLVYFVSNDQSLGEGYIIVHFLR